LLTLVVSDAEKSIIPVSTRFQLGVGPLPGSTGAILFLMPCLNHLPLRNHLEKKQKTFEFVEDQYQELLREGLGGSVMEEKKKAVAEAKRQRDLAQIAIDEHVRICETCQNELTA
jgi:hypothetical protein